MANKQPFYYAVSLTFTLNQSIDEGDFTRLMEISLKALKSKKNGPSIYVKDTFDINGWNEEPGDPADLM